VLAGAGGGGEGEFRSGGGGVTGALIAPVAQDQDDGLIERAAPGVALAAGVALLVELPGLAPR